ncbi:MAG: hypothetical protein KDA24_27085 [Deltaproteobacteria bacterium]|nr:hypothetical protein [Deltaproteobacteria bacterium]
MLSRLFLPVALLTLVASPVLSGCNNPLCDNDGDGYCAPDDCDDSDETRYPNRAEVCDGLDTNCTGRLSDEEVIDEDNDGVPLCMDCDDTLPEVQMQAPEICDGFDNDCDGVIPPEELIDEDGDGDPGCTDCDDQDPERHRDAEEICDGIDNNCDNALWWDDEAGNGENSDDDFDGFAPCMGDCDDFEPLAWPGNYEYLTDGVDNDCDGQGDNKPLLSPENDFPEMLQIFLEEECERHDRVAVWETFEDGLAGDPIGPTSLIGMQIRGNTNGSGNYSFADSATSPGPFEGNIFARPDSPVDGVSLRFDSPQTLVMWSIVGVEPNYGDQYNADIFWDGINLGGIASIFGTTNPDFTWNSRGLYSYENVAFEEIVIYDPVPGGEYVAFDNIGYCD